jgi:predicted aconitase
MKLSSPEQRMLAGEHGKATQKAMEILVALGTIYSAERMIPVTSVQIAGVSFDNLGEAGLQFLTEMADGGGKAGVLTTLNPAGMDIENPDVLGIDPLFAENQRRVIEAFARMGVLTTCTCTPYLAGNLPGFGEHIAWAESSAVCYANSVLGARTNREGGPSALAASLTGLTPAYGYHLDEYRQPDLLVDVQMNVSSSVELGALGKIIGDRMQASGRRLPYLRGIPALSMESLKSFCASLATYGGAAMFHMQGVTPEAGIVPLPAEKITISLADLAEAAESLSDASPEDIDFVSLGCPHLSIDEIARIADLLKGRRVRREFWITTARPTKIIADQRGYTQVIEASGAKFATDTCCVVAPIRGRFQALATDSAKACYYAASKNRFKTLLLPFDEVVALATRE